MKSTLLVLRTPFLALLLVFTTTFDVYAQSKQTSSVTYVANPRAAMPALARKLNLGRPRSDSPEPRATSSASGEGLYQCFERGCVYYSGRTGVRAVYGSIFAKFVAEGAEHQGLGFPTADEMPCRAPAGHRVQLFEGGRLIWNNRENTTVRVPRPGSGDGTDCMATTETQAVTTTTASLATLPERATSAPLKPETATVLNEKPSKPEAPASARFRVTLNGFLVGHETADHSLQVDGKRDEVYILAEIAEFNAAGEVLNRLSPQSVIMGDIQGQEHTAPRIPAGGASDLGGLRSSDQYPPVSPWRIATALNDRRPPMLLWEATLTRGQNGVVIVPTVWEWDGPSDLLTQYRNAMASVFGRYVRTLSATDTNFANFLAPMTGGPGTARVVGFEPTGNAADRPIGVSVRNGSFLAAHEDQQGAEWFTPQRMLLTYDLAQQAVANTRDGFGPGIFKMTYRDHPELAGVYTLYVQVQRLD